MHKKHIFSARAGIWAMGVVLCTTTLAAFAGSDAPHWSYSGEHGPAHWGQLSPDYIQCKVGLNQSPVNIQSVVDAELPPLRLDYSGHTTEIANNGHTAQVNVEPGNTLRVDGEVFELQQFHLHVPSEHHIAGKPFLMELHLVHSNAQGELAVIGILYENGPNFPALQALDGKIPREVNKPAPLGVELAALGLPSALDDYYRYNGSLTTPPCSEGVRWFVVSKPRTVSLRRTRMFTELIGEDARGPQPLNARLIVR